MITKGIIINKILNDNKYLVNIPYFSQPGLSMKSKLMGSTEFEATLCYNPGTYNAYKQGDIVFIGFEDGSPDKPIILGKLYTDLIKEEGYQLNEVLDVSKSASLPKNTTIDEVNIDTYISNIPIIKSIIDRLKALEDRSK